MVGSRLSAAWCLTELCPCAAESGQQRIFHHLPWEWGLGHSTRVHRQGDRHDPGPTHCRARPFRFRGGRPRRKGRDSSPRHDVARDVRTADGGQAYAGTLSRGGLPVLARPRAKRIDPQTLRRDGDLALLPRVRTGDATLLFAFLKKICMHGVRDGVIFVSRNGGSPPRKGLITSSATVTVALRSPRRRLPRAERPRSVAFS